MRQTNKTPPSSWFRGSPACSRQYKHSFALISKALKTALKSQKQHLEPALNILDPLQTDQATQNNNRIINQKYQQNNTQTKSQTNRCNKESKKKKKKKTSKKTKKKNSSTQPPTSASAPRRSQRPRCLPGRCRCSPSPEAPKSCWGTWERSGEEEEEVVFCLFWVHVFVHVSFFRVCSWVFPVEKKPASNDEEVGLNSPPSF